MRGGRILPGARHDRGRIPKAECRPQTLPVHGILTPPGSRFDTMRTATRGVETAFHRKFPPFSRDCYSIPRPPTDRSSIHDKTQKPQARWTSADRCGLGKFQFERGFTQALWRHQHERKPWLSMTIRNLDYLFKPHAIALIGDGGDSEVLIARNLMKSGFKGPIMPVDPCLLYTSRCV